MLNRSKFFYKLLLPGVAALIVLACLSSVAYAQMAGSATITGVVNDPSGAVVPSAAITIRNTDTGVERKTETSEGGVYNAPFLQPGKYEVQAAKGGFATVVRKDLMLQVGQTLSINLALSVQTTQQTVTVTGEAPLVDVEKTEVSQVVSQTAVSNLPIAGRRWDALRETMKMRVRSLGNRGDGVAVVNWIVFASTLFLATMALVYVVNELGLFWMVAGRSSENTTSSAVKSLPLWNLTPLRSLNSQVVSFTARHETASAGTNLLSASMAIKGS